jgi:hypothetical protein
MDITEIAEKAVIDTAKEQSNNGVEQDGITTLKSGIRVRFKPVPPYTINAVQSKIKDPVVPMVPHTDAPNDPTKRIPNPVHPHYLEEKRNVQQKRVDASMNAMVLFGVELVDPLPGDDTWLKNLIYLDVIDEKEISAIDEISKELYYKKYVVLDGEMLDQLRKHAGVTEEQVAAAMKSFRDDEERGTDPGSRAEAQS